MVMVLRPGLPRAAMKAAVALACAISFLLPGCSTDLVVRRVTSPSQEVRGLRYYLPRPFLRIATFEVRDIYDDGTKGPGYARVECTTEVLPDPKELYEVNFAAGWLTKNQFSWAYDEKFGCLLKTLSLSSESQVPEAARALASIPGHAADIAREVRLGVTAPPAGIRKVAETVRLLRVEYRPMEGGRVFP
jgi:hypothetical protein